MRLRVLQAMAGAAQGGAERFFERLVPALQAAGVDQTALIRPAPGRAERLALAGVPTRTTRFGGPLDLLSRRRFADQIAQTRPHAVVVWMSRAAACLPRLAGPDRPILIGRLGGHYPLRHYRRCDHLVGNTPVIRDWLIGQGWPAERAHCLPNFAAEAGAAPVSRAMLGVPDGAPLLVALGRLHPNKAFDVAIDALALMPGVHLAIAGAGAEEGALRARAGEAGVAGRVHWLGWREDAPALIATADVVLVPSRIEPLGNVVLEAWAGTRPVVAARADGPVGLIRDGVDGLLVPREDPAALAHAARRVLGDAGFAAGLATAGHRRHLDEFSPAAITARWQAFLEEVTPCAASPD